MKKRRNKEFIIAMPYFSYGGGCKFPKTNGKCPCFPATYYKGMSGIGARPFVMEIEDMDYMKIDRKGNFKKDQEKVSTLTVGGHGAGNHSDMDLICVAMRGRNPDNPSDRTKGINLEQTLEPNTEGKTNCLTTVSKDNLVMSCLTPKRTEYGKQIRKQYEAGEITERRKNIQRLEPREDGKTGCLTTQVKDNMIMENERKLKCVDDDNLIVPEATSKGYAEVQPGDCFDGSYLSSKTRKGRVMKEKSNCLMAQNQELYRYEKEMTDEEDKTNCLLGTSWKGSQANGMTLVDRKFRIRRLTPKECARLQTIPDWYEWKGKFPDGTIKDTSDTQIYKMCGNGWCVEVIKHIFSFMKNEG